MVYRNDHYNCKEIECKPLTAYVRIEGKWTRIGHYGSECKKFEPLDLQQEEHDRLTKQKLEQLKFMIRDAKKEDSAVIKRIDDSFTSN